MQRVSRDAGFYLHWSGDSRRLYWALGPELFSRDSRDTFAFVRAGQAAAATPRTLKTEPEAKGVPIGFTAKSDKPIGIARAGRRAGRSRWPG